jgi:hypothetical protein
MTAAAAAAQIAWPRPRIEPVAGYMQLVDAAYNLTTSAALIGENFADAFTPRGGTQVDPYAQAISAKRPFAEICGGSPNVGLGTAGQAGGAFNGFPSLRGDGGVIFITSTTANFYNATAAGTNVPWIFYITPQWIAQSDDAIFSFGNSASTLGFMELYAAVTGNKVTYARDGTVLISRQTATNDALRAVWRFAFDGTDLSVEKDGVVVSAASAFSTAGVLAGNQDAFFALVRTTAQVFGHVRFNRRLWYQKATETAAEKIQNYKFMNQGFYTPVNSSLLVTVGDSTSQVLHPWWLQIEGIGGVYVWDPAISSQPLNPNMVSFQLDQLTSVYPGANIARSAYTLYACSNDLLAGTSAATLEPILTTYAGTDRAAVPSRDGIIGTVPAAATITGAAETERLALNAYIRANYVAMGFPALADRDAALGGTAFPSSGLTFDGTHCNDAGNAIIAAITKTALQSLGKGW